MPLWACSREAPDTPIRFPRTHTLPPPTWLHLLAVHRHLLGAGRHQGRLQADVARLEDGGPQLPLPALGAAAAGAGQPAERTRQRRRGLAGKLLPSGPLAAHAHAHRWWAAAEPSHAFCAYNLPCPSPCLPPACPPPCPHLRSKRCDCRQRCMRPCPGSTPRHSLSASFSHAWRVWWSFRKSAACGEGGRAGVHDWWRWCAHVRLCVWGEVPAE